MPSISNSALQHDCLDPVILSFDNAISDVVLVSCNVACFLSDLAFIAETRCRFALHFTIECLLDAIVTCCASHRGGSSRAWAHHAHIALQTSHITVSSSVEAKAAFELLTCALLVWIVSSQGSNECSSVPFRTVITRSAGSRFDRVVDVSRAFGTVAANSASGWHNCSQCITEESRRTQNAVCCKLCAKSRHELADWALVCRGSLCVVTVATFWTQMVICHF